MALTFNGSPLKGTAERIHVPSFELQVERRKFAGVIGESERMLERGGRLIVVDAILHDSTYTSFATLVAVLDATDAILGTHGSLVDSTISRTYDNCTFEAFELDPRGPLPDFAQTIHAGVTTYWVRAQYRFRQLAD